MTKALIIGDLHLSGTNLSETQLACRDIVNVAQHLEIDMIVFLGDVFDKFQNIHVATLRVMTDMVIELKRKAPVIIITGNHDRINNQEYLTNNHPFHGIQELPNVHVAATRVIDFTHGTNRFMFVPYVPDGMFRKAIDEHYDIEKEQFVAIFAHQTFKGVNFGHHVSETGDEWPETNPLVISGHIHGYHIFKQNIIYAGACMQHHASDSDDRAVMYCYFNETDVTTIVHNAQLTYRRIRLDSVPRKYVLEMTCEQLRKYKPKAQNDIVHIHLSGTATDIKTTLKLASVQKLPPNIKISVRRQADHESELKLIAPKQSFMDFIELGMCDSLRDFHKTVVDDLTR